MAGDFLGAVEECVLAALIDSDFLKKLMRQWAGLVFSSHGISLLHTPTQPVSIER
jgi:hypothetical protein